MPENIFPPPIIFKRMFELISYEFPKKLQANYPANLRDKGLGLQQEVLAVLERYDREYGYIVNFADDRSITGFSGLIHKFDAGIQNRSDLKQCLFEVKWRSSDGGQLDQEDIIKFHHSTFEYFLKLFTQQNIDEIDIFRCFVTNFEVNDEYRRFFYSWGIALIDPKLPPLPMMADIFRDAQRRFGPTEQTIELIERAELLIDKGYFSLANLVPPNQLYTGILELSALNPEIDSQAILDEHKLLQDEILAIQQRHHLGKFR